MAHVTLVIKVHVVLMEEIVRHEHIRICVVGGREHMSDRFKSDFLSKRWL